MNDTKRKSKSLLWAAKRPCRCISPSSDHFSKRDFSVEEISYEEFELLDGQAQRKCYDAMRKSKNEWESFKASCPRVDMKALQHYDNNNRLTSEEQSNANHLILHFNEIWPPEGLSFQTVPKQRRIKTKERVRWYDSDLRWSQEKFEFVFDCPELHYQNALDLDEPLVQSGLYKHITSSLLWYRLNIFREFPLATSTDKYKCCWDIKFHHRDRASTLRIWDNKGAPRAVFDGLKESEDDALKLLNFLTMFKFPHTYDGVIAGTVA